MLFSPKIDDFIKEMFQNKTVRLWFLSDVLGLPVEEIRSVCLKNTFLNRKFLRQKQGILDILIVMNDNTKINIELQVKTVPDWDKRQIFYLAKLYVADLWAGEKYARLRRCVGISILDFNLTNRKEYHSVYRLRDQDGIEFSDMLEIHVLELKKKLTGQPVDEWIEFFNSKSEEDIEMIKAKTKNPGILEAIRMLREMSLTGYMREAYEARMKALRDQWAREDYARDEGIIKGRKEGKIEGRKEGKIEGKIEDILELLEEKGSVPKALKEQISSQRDPERLREWFKLAARCKSLEEFQEAYRRD